MRRRTIAILVARRRGRRRARGLASGPLHPVAGRGRGRRSAPPASPILVPAEERLLSTDIVTRGTARFGSPRCSRWRRRAEEWAPDRHPPAGRWHRARRGRRRDDRVGQAGVPSRGQRALVSRPGPGHRGRGRAPAGAGPGTPRLRSRARRTASTATDTEAAVAELYGAAGYDPVRATEEQLADIRPLEAESRRERSRRSGRPASCGRGDLRPEPACPCH